MMKSTIFLLSSVMLLSGCTGSIGQPTAQQAGEISEKLQNQRFCEIMNNTQTQNMKFTRTEAKALGPAIKRDLGALKAEYQARCQAQLSGG